MIPLPICLDTSTWFEYFNGGVHGPEVKRLLDSEQEIITPAIVAAQVIEASRLRRDNSRTFLRFLQSHSDVVPVTAEIARLAGKINALRAHPPNNWTLLESLVLATARHHRARLMTRDPLFEGITNVVQLGTATHAASRSAPASGTTSPT